MSPSTHHSAHHSAHRSAKGRADGLAFFLAAAIATISSFFSLASISAEPAKPLEVLYITGGCCHDY